MRHFVIAASLSALLTMPAAAQTEQEVIAQVQQECGPTGVYKVFVPEKGEIDVIVNTPEGGRVDPKKFNALLATHPKKIKIYSCTMPELTEADLNPEQLKAYVKTLTPFLDEVNKSVGPEKVEAQKEFERVAKSYLNNLQNQHTVNLLPAGNDFFAHIILNYMSQHYTPGSSVETYLVNRKGVVLGFGVAPWLQRGIAGMAKVPRTAEELAPENINDRLDRTFELQNILTEYEAQMTQIVSRNPKLPQIIEIMKDHPNFRLYQP
jgi:hypothetical protein